jgi:hypothetical protein
MLVAHARICMLLSCIAFTRPILIVFRYSLMEYCHMSLRYCLKLIDLKCHTPYT